MVSHKITSIRRAGGALLLFLAAALAHGAPGAADEVNGAGTEEGVTALLKARVAVARKAYDATAKSFGEVKRSGGQIILLTNPEEVYTWSVRLLQAERDLKTKQVDHIAALEGHLKRITQLQAKVKGLVPGILPASAELAAEWYRLEAELWLAQAKTRK